MKPVRLSMGKEGPEYEAPAMDLWLDQGLRTPGIYERGGNAYAAHLANLPADRQSVYAARHCLYRLTFTTMEMKEGIRNEVFKLRSIQEHLANRPRKILAGALATLGENRRQRLRGEAPDVLPDWDLDFMATRSFLQSVGVQCLPEYIGDGFKHWERGSTALTCSEYLAAARHYNLCFTCAEEWIRDDWRYGPVLLADSVIGAAETLATMRAALTERRERFAAR